MRGRNGLRRFSHGTKVVILDLDGKTESLLGMKLHGSKGVVVYLAGQLGPAIFRPPSWSVRLKDGTLIQEGNAEFLTNKEFSQMALVAEIMER